ncbi:MAG: hypothetical protein L0I29_15975 [Hyphomicrobiales bacterium]|nr:hypothetical protein [Hyphomicrobiales bacterium]
MSLLHIGVALGLSAVAAFLVTGATMRSLEPDVAVACTDVGPAAIAEPLCQTTAKERPAGNMSNTRSDTGRSAYGH